MRIRRHVAAAFGLLVLLPALAACGGDAAELEAGDLVTARTKTQFSDGNASVVALPIGRLELFLGEPTTDLPAKATRGLEAIDAPSGTTFVPITWQYDAATFGAYDDFIGEPQIPTVELVADKVGYRIPSPESTGTGAKSFYVLVTGSARDLDLAVTYDEVTQTVDLRTGERDEGVASGLYDLDRRSTKTRSCVPGADFHTPGGLPEYTCEATDAVRLAYAHGEWAAPRKPFLGVTLQTNVRRFTAFATELGSGGLYVPDAVTTTFRAGGSKPFGVKTETVNTCPDPDLGGCSGRYHVVIKPKGAKPGPIKVEQTFNLLLGSKWGVFDGAETRKLRVSFDLPLRRATARR